MNSLFMLVNFVIIIGRVHPFQSFYKKNACTDGTPDRKLESLNYFHGNFTCDREKYGRGRILNCIFFHKLPDEGEETVNHFLTTILVKDKSKQNNYIGVGKFINWTDNAIPIQCKSDVDTTLINKDDSTKDKIEFLWESPAEDVGQLYFVMSYSGSEYYAKNAVNTDLNFIDYPVSLEECGKKKSCMRYASNSKSCDAVSCKYAITYSFADSYHNTVKFTFDIHETNENAYLAIAFTKNIPEEDNMTGINVFACIKHSKDISAKSYIFNEKNALVRSKMEENFQAFNEDHDKYYFGCKFEMPVKVSGKNSLNWNETLYRMYFWGKFDNDAGTPVLPVKPWSRSREAHSLQMHSDELFPHSGVALLVGSLSLPVCICLNLFVLYFI